MYLSGMKRNVFYLLVLISCISIVGCGEVNIIEQPTQDEVLAEDLEQIEEYRQAEGLTFIEDSAAFPVQYLILEVGSGEEVEYEDIVFCDYNLKLLTGEVFHTSMQDVAEANDIFDESINYQPSILTHTQTGWGVNPLLGQPSVNTNSNFELGWRIGLTAALNRMNIGGQATIIAPSTYAYQNFNPFGIPDNSIVIYEVFVRNAK